MRKNTILNFYLIIQIGLICNSLKSQGPPTQIANALQDIINNALPTQLSNSGIVFSLHVPGQWTWQGASGYSICGMTAGQSASTALPESKFRVGSITKTMVATCILKLEESGLLNTEDPIDNYLRSTLVNDTIIPSTILKIRHLLNHTSGIANSADNPTCQTDVLSNPLGTHSIEEAIYCGTSQGEIFPPEFAWGYSNTNYSILAMIIEEVSGLSYESFLTQNIINPLNLTKTEIPTTPQINGSHMGCYWNIGSWIDLTIIHPSTYTGWADVVSTADDLNIFYKNLLDGNIISQPSLTKMKTIYPASFDYGLGLDFYLLDGHDYYGHSGEVANTSSMFFADVNTTLTPNGYYLTYNFNMQGAEMANSIDIPVYNLLNNVTSETIENKIEKQEFMFFPNPVSKNNLLTIICDQKGECSLLDLQGKKVIEKNIEAGTNHFNINQLNTGIYIIQYKKKEKLISKKVIVK